MTEYTPFERKALDSGQKNRWNAKRLFIPGKVTLENAIEELRQKGKVPEEVLKKAIEIGMEDGSLSVVYQSDAFEKYVLPMPELKEFRKTVQPFLTTEQNQRMVAVLAPILYAKLSDRAKKELTERMIMMKSLNLGYIRLPRASHRLACNFIVNYPALFRNETEVIEGMVERLVDEELSTAPIDETKQKIRELKGELKKIYESIKK